MKILILLSAVLGLSPWAYAELPARYESGTAWLDCDGLSGVGQSCFWFYRFNKLQCGSRQKPCDKLVIFYGGGEQSCDSSYANETTGYGKLAKEYADDGYVFACAQLFEDSEGSSSVPYNRESDRVHRLQVTITTGLRTGGMWSGKKLLIAGVSHGATAPVLAMKHTNFDQTSYWQGSQKTGACFFDGISDVYYLDSWFDDSLACRSSRDRMFCQRYNFNAGCQAGRQTEDRDRDTISSPTMTRYRASPSNFAIRDWKLVECGSALSKNKCLYTNDAVPATPQERLCGIIRSDAIHRCTFERYPQVGHLDCMDTATQGACRGWFNGLR